MSGSCGFAILAPPLLQQTRGWNARGIYKTNPEEQAQIIPNGQGCQGYSQGLSNPIRNVPHLISLAGISVFIFRPTGNIHTTASECKLQSSFQCRVLPRTAEGVSFTFPENPKARNCRSLTDSSDTFPSPNLPRRRKSAPVCGSPTPLVPQSGIVPRSCTACLRRAASCRRGDTLCQEQPIIASLFDQPPAGLHQPLLQAGERPVANSLGQHQPPSRLAGFPRLYAITLSHSRTSFDPARRDGSSTPSSRPANPA